MRMNNTRFTIHLLSAAIAAFWFATSAGVVHATDASALETEPIRKHGVRAEEFSDLGKFAEAEAEIAQVLELATKPEALKSPSVPICLSWCADVYQNEGKYEEAEKLLRRAIAIDKIRGADPSWSMTTLAGVLEHQGRLSETVQMLKEAANTKPQSKDVDRKQSQYPLACFYWEHGQYAQAEPGLKAWWPARSKEIAKYPEWAAEPLAVMGAFYEEWGKFDQAQGFLEKALTVSTKNCGPDSEQAIGRSMALGMLCYTGGNYAAASKYLQRALATRVKKIAKTDRTNAHLQLLIANCHSLSGQPSEQMHSEQMYKKSIEMFQATCGPNSPDLAFSIEQYCDYLASKGQTSHANELSKRAANIWTGADSYWQSMPAQVFFEFQPAVCVTTTKEGLAKEKRTLIRVIDRDVTWQEEWKGRKIERKIVALIGCTKTAQIIRRNGQIEVCNADAYQDQVFIHRNFYRFADGRLQSETRLSGSLDSATVQGALNRAAAGQPEKLNLIDFSGSELFADPRWIASALSTGQAEAEKLNKTPSLAADRLHFVFDSTKRISRASGPLFWKKCSDFQQWLTAWSNLKKTDYIPALADYGFYLAEAGKVADATPILKAVLAVDPSNTTANLGMADALWQSNNQSEARKRYDAYRLIMKTNDAADKIPERVTERLKTH
jgi:tetratricopeptide (TPR) repeat protein